MSFCILTDKLPEDVIINGEAYRINTDFATWIRFSEAMLNFKNDAVGVAVEVINICMAEKRLPDNIFILVEALFEFYKTGLAEEEAGFEEKEKETEKRGRESKKVIYDFIYDAKYIYAAFLSQYGIDLCKENIHWFKFCALFRGLSDEEKISKIMGYRSVKIDDVKDKKQKAFIRKMKSIYRLPDNRSEEERNSDISNVLDRIM